MRIIRARYRFRRTLGKKPMDITGDTPLLLLPEDQQSIVAAQAELRLLGVAIDIEQPDGGDFPEIVFVSESFRRNETRWAAHRAAAGVWLCDLVRAAYYGPFTMREAMARIEQTVRAEMAATIAAIPLLRLPRLPGLQVQPSGRLKGR
jgi:hypothetical protein